MNHLKLLPILTVQISQTSNYMGSAVLVKVDDIFYVLTAAHVLFGKECADYSEGLSASLIYESETLGELKFVKELGDIGIFKAHDILAIEVEGNINNESFPEVLFTSDTDFPELEFLFRGRAKSTSKEFHTIEPCKKNGTSHSNIHLKIPVEDYTDFKGDVGAEVLQGFSGSGVFIHDNESNDAYLTSIVKSVSQDNFTGVNCACISLIKEHLVPSIKLVNFDYVVESLTRKQLEILKCTLPKIDESYQSIKSIEMERKNEILNYKSTMIVGFGGIGKSSFCNSLLHQTKHNFQISLWLDATFIKSLDELGSFDIDGNGNKINVLFLLKSRRCLLVLDNITNQ